jgi:hypothetical protein
MSERQRGLKSKGIAPLLFDKNMQAAFSRLSCHMNAFRGRFWLSPARVLLEYIILQIAKVVNA